MIGLVIVIGLNYFDDSRILVAARNWALDAAMQGKAEAGTRGDKTPPLIFIEVDEETWRNPRWGRGEPFRAPYFPFAFASGRYGNAQRQLQAAGFACGRYIPGPSARFEPRTGVICLVRLGIQHP